MDLNLVRRELKYHIPLSIVPELSSYIECFCKLDHYSAIAPDQQYVINSLYLDNDDMHLLRNKEQGQARRFNMRIRSYSDTPNFPVFLEIKGKRDGLINKKRAAITSWSTIDYFRGEGSGEDNPDLLHPTIQAGYFNIQRLRLKPKVMTRYKRKAYVGFIETYSRVTFDRNMCCYRESDYNIFPTDSAFRNYDHPDLFDDPNMQVVLELKCERKVPHWMSRMIQRFGLRHSSYSKYQSAWEYANDDIYKQNLYELKNPTKGATSI